MHTANIDVKMDKDITLDLPANVECTYEIDSPKKFSAELYDQNIQATITFTADNKSHLHKNNQYHTSTGKEYIRKNHSTSTELYKRLIA